MPTEPTAPRSYCTAVHLCRYHEEGGAAGERCGTEAPVDAPVTASAHPAPSTMAHEAIIGENPVSRVARHWYEEGAAAELARGAAWLRTHRDLAGDLGRLATALADELEGRGTRVYRLSVVETRAWAKPEMRERICEAARGAYPVATTIEIRDSFGMLIGGCEGKATP